MAPRIPASHTSWESTIPAREDLSRLGPGTPDPRLVRFAAFEFDLEAGELRKAGTKIKLEGQPIQVLSVLLERSSQLVTREELKERLWPADTFVDFEHSINSSVMRLRQALDDSADTPRFIETLPRRGYRFIYPLNGAAAETSRSTTESWWRRRLVGVLPLIVLAAVLAGVLAYNVGGLRDRLAGPPSKPPITSLAVLPLENLTGDPEQEYLVDGIHDELVTQVAQISSLKVISRTSVQRYKQTRLPLRQIASELGVDGIVEGAVQRHGDRLHVNAQLIYAPTDAHLWAHR
jgi:TolB-like protein/DNA-binding winged helix-turn-helix (wHTH) protein